jgi:hypothetical protein
MSPVTGRPIYETQDNLDAEKKLVGILEGEWHCKMRKLSRKAQIDYAIFRKGELVGFAEIKCRTNRKDAYKTYMLSLDKISAALRLNAITALPVLLVVSWSDTTGCMRIVKPDEVNIGGRVDRNDPQDIELVGYYDITKHFRDIQPRKT